MLRDGRATAWAPLRRAMALVEAALLVHELEEAPDVLDVRVREREVVVSPVHPLPEPLAAAGQLRRRPDHLLPATARELGQAVLLDLRLRVEPELALDAHLDPEPLAVEAVLVPLLESPHGLVALKDVLERPAPRRVHGERLVRRDGPVDEAEPRPAAVLLAKLLERPVALPDVENLALERVVIRLVREWCEDRRHGVSLGTGNKSRVAVV